MSKEKGWIEVETLPSPKIVVSESELCSKGGNHIKHVVGFLGMWAQYRCKKCGEPM